MKTTKLKLDKKMVKIFFYWINERHNIYLKRKNDKPWPWTKDKILQEYRFCNVFRELDTVTQWIEKNWRKPYKNHKNLWFAMVMARHINWPPTLEALGFPKTWNPKKMKRIMKARKDNGEKIYTGAYMLTGSLGGTKIEQTIDKILTPLYENPITITKKDNLESTVKKLLPYKGFSDFLSYEAVTDLRHTRYLREANDIMTWANPGPGAIRGLHKLYGIKVPSVEERKQRKKDIKGGGTSSLKRIPKMNAAWYQEKMQYLLKISPKYLKKNVPALEMRDIEHSLCEFDKYSRVKFGEGRPRSKYKPPVV